MTRASVRARTLDLISRKDAKKGKRGPEAPIASIRTLEVIAGARDPLGAFASLRLCVSQYQRLNVHDRIKEGLVPATQWV
jgi:hypothetical protein